MISKAKLKSWAMTKAAGPQGKFWLAALSFAESSFFPIPPDFLLMAVLLSSDQRRRWLFWASLTTLFSVLGGIFGYLIGYSFFASVGHWLVGLYNLEGDVSRVANLFANNAFLTVFTSAFTPIPYKVFTIAAGFFHINFFVFILASLLGRAARFFAVAFLMKLYGTRISAIVYRYFNLFSLIVVLILILIIYSFL